MSRSAVLLQPAFILQHREYRETSLILDVLTRDYGVLSILAKGARKKKSRQGGLLMPFIALNISFQGNSDLKILTGSEILCTYRLTGLAVFCGFYLNELMYYFLHRNDPHPELYDDYQRCLQNLKDAADFEFTLRTFELRLLEQIGYGLPLSYDSGDNMPVVKQARYRYQAGVGVVRSQDGYICGSTLLALQSGSPLSSLELAEAKRLLRTVLDDLLQGRELKSRAVLASISRYLH